MCGMKKVREGRMEMEDLIEQLGFDPNDEIVKKRKLRPTRIIDISSSSYGDLVSLPKYHTNDSTTNASVGNR